MFLVLRCWSLVLEDLVVHCCPTWQVLELAVSASLISMLSTQAICTGKSAAETARK
jgi:hypothetical protein